jgi:hypothetical protein
MARGARHRLEARAAQAVDGGASDLLREACQEERHPGHVAVVLSGLVGAPHVDVLHLFWWDAGSLHECLENQSAKVVGTDRTKRATVPSDGGAYRADDPGFVDLPVGYAHALLSATTPGRRPA